MGAVQDWEGRVVRYVRVQRGEMTCTKCGEVTTEFFCRRCNAEGLDEDEPAVPGTFGNVRASSSAGLVPTVSYLREGEYREV